MIVTRRHLDCWNTPGTSSCIFPGGVSRCYLRSGNLVLISCYSVYLKDSIGLVGVNLKVLKAIVSDIVGHGLPCIIGGGFNLKPDVLAACGPLTKLQGVVRADSLPAFVSDDKASIIDFFILSRILDRVGGDVSADLHGAFSPHRPVYLGLKHVG
eukprot:318111-Pyramimonas_sp.AAC.1